jgi:hypothetical protein
MQELSEEEREAKLEYIALRWGLDRASIIALAESPKYSDVLGGLSESAKRKFRRYLGSMEQVFEKLGRSLVVRDRQLESGLQRTADDEFFVGYIKAISQGLTSSQFARYKNGDWDEEIRGVVLDAHRRLLPSRPKSRISQEGRARFMPLGNYSERMEKK